MPQKSTLPPTDHLVKKPQMAQINQLWVSTQGKGRPPSNYFQINQPTNQPPIIHPTMDYLFQHPENREVDQSDVLRKDLCFCCFYQFYQLEFSSISTWPWHQSKAVTKVHSSYKSQPPRPAVVYLVVIWSKSKKTAFFVDVSQRKYTLW